MTGELKIGVAAQRALELLEAVAEARRPVSGKEVMDRMSLPKPTIYRLCKLLEGMGMLQREPESKRLTIGPRLSALALQVIFSSVSRAPIRAILQSLSEETGETCTFTILDGNEAVCVDRVESDAPLRLSLQAGSRIPLHCTASGKLFLAMMPGTIATRLLKSGPLKRYTPKTNVDPLALEQELRRVRKEKVGWDDEGYCSDLVAVAVPVIGKRGRICGTVSVNAPANRMSLAKAAREVPRLRRAAQAIAASLREGALPRD